MLTAIIISVCVAIIITVSLTLKSRGKPKDGWSIKDGSYKILAIYGFHALLNEVDSTGIERGIIRYYYWDIEKYIKSGAYPYTLSLISPITDLPN